jgi:methyltransferase (TIGR00027 family)
MRATHLMFYQPVVFDDPFAFQLMSPSLQRVTQNHFFQWLFQRNFIFKSLRLQSISAQVLVRAKYAEEKLEEAVAKGITQYVIISAGLDSFCLRRPEFSTHLQIYEIDHPATQQIKQKRLKPIMESFPPNVEFISVDLEKQTISNALSSSSYLKEKRAFFSWLGTVPYLSEEAIFKVLGELSTFATQGSEIVFDYLIPTDFWAPDERQALLRIMRIIGRWGEAVKTYFAPDTFLSDLNHLGYNVIGNLSPLELNKLYFSNRSDGLMTHSAAYLIHAKIVRF